MNIKTTEEITLFYQDENEIKWVAVDDDLIKRLKHCFSSSSSKTNERIRRILDELESERLMKMAKCCGNCWWNENRWCHNGDIKVRVNKKFVCDFKGDKGHKAMDERLFKQGKRQRATTDQKRKTTDA